MNKNISSIIAILIILIAASISVFLIQEYTKLEIISNFSLEYNSSKEKEEIDLPKEEDNENQNENKKEKPKVAIILDDLGNSYNTDKKISEIEENLTLAILPKREATISSASYLDKFNNFELILHLPLEPLRSKDIENDMIMTNMNEEEIRLEMEDYLKELKKYVTGINNHKGSKFTANRDKMKTVLEIAKEKNLFFVDSFTYKDSIVIETAYEVGVKTNRRDVFLDNSNDEIKIKQSLEEAIEVAKEKGSAIAIGHSRPNTISVLKQELPKYQNIEFVKVSKILY